MKKIMRELVIYNYDPTPEVIRDIEEMLINRKLRHLATDLALFGIDRPEEITEAIERAIEVCRMAGVPVAEHFKPVFFCRNNKVFRDWRLSDLALKLAIINAGIDHEFVCLTQVDLVRRSLNDMV